MSNLVKDTGPHIVLKELAEAETALAASQVRERTAMDGNNADMALSRLHDRGLVDRTPAGEVGQPRYYYEINDEGEAALEAVDD